MQVSVCAHSPETRTTREVQPSVIVRNDIRQSATIIPKALKETIRRVGGTNIYGEPMFRLLLAEDRIVKAAGSWAIWPDSASLEDRGGLGIQRAQEMILAGKSAEEITEFLEGKVTVSPLRVDEGMAEIPLYTVEGFVLEKWKPAASFGAPSDWTETRFNGEPAAGPYPEFGDYELVAGPTPHMPSAEQLEDAIRRNFHDIEDRPSSAKERVALLLARKQLEREARQREQRQKADDFRRDGPASLRNRLSLGAGRVIQELATKAGLKGHYGN